MLLGRLTFRTPKTRLGRPTFRTPPVIKTNWAHWPDTVLATNGQEWIRSTTTRFYRFFNRTFPIRRRLPKWSNEYKGKMDQKPIRSSKAKRLPEGLYRWTDSDIIGGQDVKAKIGPRRKTGRRKITCFTMNNSGSNLMPIPLNVTTTQVGTRIPR